MSASGDDIDRLMAVMQAAFDPAFGEAWNRRQVEDALLIGSSSYTLIDAAGNTPQAGEPAAGFFLSRQGFEEEELLLLAVVPELRRKGLAARLLNQFAANATARGAKRLLLEMRKGNAAESLYRSHGFVQIGERPNYYRTATGERLDAVTFARDL
jgi:[ribosomal protein S18]-alanine N-acetyltransferase